MAVDSNQSSLIWDSSSSPLQFQSSSLSAMPDHFNRSMVAPMILSQRKRHSHAAILQLPPLKLRSTMTWNSSEEEEKFLSQSVTSTEQEMTLFRQKYDRLRASLSQSLQHNRHTYDKILYKKSTIQQTIEEHDQLIDQLSIISHEWNEKISKSKKELSKQRRERDNEEMRQLKLRRTLTRLNQTKDQVDEVLQTNNKTQLIEEYEARLSALTKQCKKEIRERDEEIDELKETLSDEFHYRSDEYLKFLKATEHAVNLESQKCDILQEYIDNYKTHVYRARKPCCVSTSHRLCKVSTQLRLYLIMELALHELFRSSCSCGPFQRSYQTFMRLHKK